MEGNTDATKENIDVESRDTVGDNSIEMVPMFRYDGADETKSIAICREDDRRPLKISGSDRGQYSSLRQSAVMAFHSVGSFFGVDSQNDIAFWKDKLARRIRIEKVNTKERRKKKRRQITDELMQQKQELQDMMNEAKEKYSIFPGSAKGNICTGLKEDDTKQAYGGTGDKGQDRDCTKQAYVRSQLEALPEFTPVFIYMLTIVQIVLFCILCALGGLAPIQLQPSTTYMEHIKTFVGTETVESKTLPNLWIGPSARYWIGVGALFTPCMRSDHKILTYYASLSYDMSDKLGCCEVMSRNTAGTTTQEECQHQTQGAGVWKSKKCSEREAGENSVAHILKPCCIGLTGQCVLVTHEHCTFHQGVYHTDEDHCNQVNCLQDVCNFGGFNIRSSSGDCPLSSVVVRPTSVK